MKNLDCIKYLKCIILYEYNDEIENELENELTNFILKRGLEKVLVKDDIVSFFTKTDPDRFVTHFKVIQIEYDFFGEDNNGNRIIEDYGTKVFYFKKANDMEDFEEEEE